MVDEINSLGIFVAASQKPVVSRSEDILRQKLEAEAVLKGSPSLKTNESGRPACLVVIKSFCLLVTPESSPLETAD
jgi:hypothetical protein